MPTNNPLDRPLGQQAAPHGPRRRRLSWSDAALALAGIVLVAASSAIALRERPYRTLATLPPMPPPAETAAASKMPPAQPGGSEGPKIIKVEVEPAPPPFARNLVIVRDPSSVGQDLRVAHLPDRALIEESETGPLPIRSADGRRPFDVYARPWSGARGARVAIVIGGLGVSQTGTQDAIRKLPPEVTLALASGGNSLGRWMQTARQKGHEIVMQLPLEPFDYPNVDPGRNTLTLAASQEENLAALRWTLSRTTNYTGVMNYMGARFTADSAAMTPLMEELGKRGLLYLDDGSSARSTAPELAAKAGVPFASADTPIDALRERGEILKKLDEVERTARAKGFAIGTGSAFPETVEAVATWVDEARKRGIEIVPVSAVASDPQHG